MTDRMAPRGPGKPGSGRSPWGGSLWGRSLCGRSPSTAWIRLGLAALILTVLKSGLGVFPEWRRFADATTFWPDFAASPLLTEADATLVSNSAGAWLLGAVGLRGAVPYLAGSLALACVAVVLPFLMPIARGPQARVPLTARMLFIVVAGGAVAPVLLSWIGSYDALVVIGLTIAALSRHRWSSALGWFIVGVAHATVAAFALALWIPMALVTRRERTSAQHVLTIASASAGVLIGWLTMRTIADSWGGSADRWQLFQRLSASDVLHAYASGWPLVLFGALGISWLIVLRPAVRATVPGRVMLTEALLAAGCIPLIAVDETRITVLCLLASTFTWAVWTASQQAGADVLTEHWRTYGLAAAIVPIIVVWQGATLYPGWDVVRTWQALGIGP